MTPLSEYSYFDDANKDKCIILSKETHVDERRNVCTIGGDEYPHFKQIMMGK